MKLRAFSSLLLGCLLVMTAQGLGGSLSRVDQGDQEGNKNKLEVTRITSMYVQKEPFEGTGGAHTRKLGPVEKKLTKHEETSMNSQNDKEADEEGTSEISGKEKDALQKSFGSLRDRKNDIQKHMEMGPNVWKFTSFAIRRSSLTNTNMKCKKDCNAVPANKPSLKSSSKSEGTSQKDETPSIGEAAKEITSLFYKDYKGKPSHKPPINNHEPRD